MPVTWKPDHAKPNNFAAWEPVIRSAAGPATQVTMRQVGNSWCVDWAESPGQEDCRAVVTLALLREDYPVIECP